MNKNWDLSTLDTSLSDLRYLPKSSLWSKNFEKKVTQHYQKALTFLFLGVRGSYLESELILAETFISDAFQTFLWSIWSKFQARYLSFHDNSVSILSDSIRGLSGPEIFLKSIWKTPEMNVSAMIRSLSKYEVLTLKNKKVTTFWFGSLFFYFFISFPGT